VFKTKDIPYETGYIPRKGNPFFGEILDYINERKDLDNKRRIEKGGLYYPVTLFGDVPVDWNEEEERWEHTAQLVERYFWRFKRQVYIAVKKVNPSFKLHSLRVSRATDAAESSKGDIFFVQGVTRHRDIKNLEQYVKPVQIEKKVEDYA
jgi:hypothetical protein